MEICAQKIENTLKGNFTSLWNRLPGETINETWERVQTWNDKNWDKWMPLPETTVALLHCITRWSRNRVVYRIDRNLGLELSEMAEDMKEDDPLPAQFLRLPFDSISIQLDTSEETQKFRELNIPIDSTFGDDVTFTVTETEPGEIHPWRCIVASMTSCLAVGTTVLPIGETVGESVKAALEFRDKSPHWMARENRRLIERNKDMPGAESLDERETATLKQLIQVLLYINSTDSDQQEVTERLAEGKAPRAERKRVKREIGNTKVIDVGYHIGRLLKGSRTGAGQHAGSAGGKKRSHFRRAHWHHYWTGKRDGERELILKWVMVTAIHPEGLDEKPTVVMVR